MTTLFSANQETPTQPEDFTVAHPAGTNEWDGYTRNFQFDSGTAAGTPSTTSIPSNISISTGYPNYFNDLHAGFNLEFTSGGQSGVARAVTTYNATTGTFTTAAFPGAPAAGDTFKVYRADETSGSCVVDSAIKRSGGYSIKWSSNTVPGGGLSFKLDKLTDPILTRAASTFYSMWFYVQKAPYWVVSNAPDSYLMPVHFYSNGRPFCAIYLETHSATPGTFGFLVNNADGHVTASAANSNIFTGDGAGEHPINQWVNLEIEFPGYIDTYTGNFRVWVDGVLKKEAVGNARGSLGAGGPGPNGTTFTLMNYGGAGVSGGARTGGFESIFNVDDVVVSDSRVWGAPAYLPIRLSGLEMLGGLALANPPMSKRDFMLAAMAGIAANGKG